VEGVITTEGSTANLRVASAPDARLAAAAVATVASQQWRPAYVRTTAVEVPLHITVEFTIDGY
jgi:outer membrane biosynthesis protein TonB